MPGAVEVRRVEGDEELARVAALADEIARLDGVGIAEPLTDVGTDPGTFAIVAIARGEPVGFASVSPIRPSEIGLAVHPDLRRTGIGSALLEHVLSDLRVRGESEALIVCDRASVPGMEFLAAIGSAYAYSEFRMERRRGTSPSKGPNTDLEVRTGTSSDRELMIRLLAVAFNEREDEAAETIDDGLAETERAFAIGIVGGEPVGIVRVGVWGGLGDITALGVVPGWRGKGYGRALMMWAVSALEADGHDRMALEVAAGNQNALGLYRSCGFLITNEFTYNRISTLP